MSGERKGCQGKGRGNVSGKRKGTNVRSKEREVYQTEGRGRVSAVKKGKYP